MLLQHYPIKPGTLFGGEYPGDINPEIARAKIRALVELGVRTFIDLTAPDDPLRPYEEFLVELEKETGTSLHRISLPVPDMDVPRTEEAMREIMDSILRSIETGPAVYIHCWGGIGRTGTAAGCWLRECGMGPEEALERVQHLYSTHMPKSKDLRYPQSPQTPKQHDYVRNWNPGE